MNFIQIVIIKIFLIGPVDHPDLTLRLRRVVIRYNLAVIKTLSGAIESPFEFLESRGASSGRGTTVGRAFIQCEAKSIVIVSCLTFSGALKNVPAGEIGQWFSNSLFA